MNIKCPYCSCSYNISLDLLKNPVGNERLGYGWWLRCYKCKKKFWLKNTDVKIQTDTPAIYNKKEKIKKISKLSRLYRSNKEVNKSSSKKFFEILFIVLLLITPIIFYINKDNILDFVKDKATTLFKMASKKISLENVRYLINEDNIIVKGFIKNQDKNVINIEGVEIKIFDGDNEIKSWKKQLDFSTLLPEDRVEFIAENDIDEFDFEDLRVEVSIF